MGLCLTFVGDCPVAVLKLSVPGCNSALWSAYGTRHQFNNPTRNSQHGSLSSYCAGPWGQSLRETCTVFTVFHGGVPRSRPIGWPCSGAAE
eukprot:5903063-Prymnesium_polylepis.1